MCPSLATRVIRGHTPNPNFLWKTAKKSFLVLSCERLDRSLRFRSLGLTASQVIAQSKIGRDVGRCHGQQEERIDIGFFCKLHCGERQVDGEIFIFGCTCPLNTRTSKNAHSNAPPQKPRALMSGRASASRLALAWRNCSQVFS